MLKEYFTGKNLIFLLLVIFLLFIIPKISGIILLFFAAYVIACALNPYVLKLQGKKLTRNAAAGIAVTVAVAVIFALLIPILLIAYKEISTFIMFLPQKLMAAANYVTSLSVFGYKLSDLVTFNNIFDTSQNVAQNIVTQSWSITMGIFQVAIIVVALTMIIYYLLVDKDYLKKKFLEFFRQI